MILLAPWIKEFPSSTRRPDPNVEWSTCHSNLLQLVTHSNCNSRAICMMTLHRMKRAWLRTWQLDTQHACCPWRLYPGKEIEEYGRGLIRHNSLIDSDKQSVTILSMLGHTHRLGYTSQDRNRFFGMVVVVHCTSLSPPHCYGFFSHSALAAVNVRFLMAAHGLNPNLKRDNCHQQECVYRVEEVLAYPVGFRTCYPCLSANFDRI